MQTSIEWFIENLLGNGLLRLTKDDHNLYSKLRDEAKEMHKQEIINTVLDVGSFMSREEAEQYYQETFCNG
jgi:hypothetical protein